MFALFVLTIVFFALYVAYKIVGDPFLKLVKVTMGTNRGVSCRVRESDPRFPSVAHNSQRTCEGAFGAEILTHFI